MTWWEILLAIEVPHNFAGMGIALCFNCDGFEFVNPNWIYQNYKVNRFGSIFLSVLFGLFCPIGTIIYWLYKLCTVGRRQTMNFYNAWEFLLEHKMFQRHFRDLLYIMVVKVNPVTSEVDDDQTKNTKTEIWLEVGPWNEQYHTHDWDLDCGGDTFEEAIIKLADLVKQYYNDDGIKKSELNTTMLES